MATVTAPEISDKDHPKVVEIPMNEIFHDEEFNCRGKIIPFEVQDLAKNIQEQGLIQPIIVQPYSKGPSGTKYRIVAGYRRHIAHIVNNAKTIASIIREGLSDRDAKFLNLSENLNRKELNLMQEARVLAQFFDEGMTQQEIADKVNMSRSWVQVRLYALKLPEAIQKEVEVGIVDVPHIHAIHNLPEAKQFEIVKDLKEKKQAGEKRVPINKAMVKKDPTKPRRREKVEIAKLREYLLDSTGSNFGTRCLAWAEGEIPTSDIYDDIEEMMAEKGIPWLRPEEDL